MKKIVFVYLFTWYLSLTADFAAPKELSQSTVKNTVSREIMELARQAAARYDELTPQCNLPKEKHVQETSDSILAKMRLHGKKNVAKDLSLTQIYTKAHELAVEVGDTRAAHMLKEEIDDSQRGFLHSFVHRNPELVTFLVAGIPFLIGVILALAKPLPPPAPARPRHPQRPAPPPSVPNHQQQPARQEQVYYVLQVQASSQADPGIHRPVPQPLFSGAAHRLGDSNPQANQ